MRIASLFLILCSFANAETFKMVWSDTSPSARLFCLDWEREDGILFGTVRPCTVQDGYENLLGVVNLSVFCASENLTITAPLYLRHLASANSLYDIVSNGYDLKVGFRELRQRLGHEYRIDKLTVDGPIIQHYPVDTWFWGGGGSPLTGEGCGGRRLPYNQSKFCHQVRTSGSLRWNSVQIRKEDRAVATFSIPRDTLWNFLQERQNLSDCHDSGDCLEAENEFLEMRVWRVDSPDVKLIMLGDQASRNQSRTSQSSPQIFSMFGKARAKDGFHLQKMGPSGSGVDWNKVPNEISEELNRLHAFWSSCQDTQVAEPPPPPAPIRPPLDYSAINAKEYLKIMRLVDTVWDDYKDMTLEEYVDLP